MPSAPSTPPSLPATPAGWAVAGLRLILEIGVLVALGWWGLQLNGPPVIRYGVAVGVALLAAAVWGTFVAPNAARRLDDPARLGVELAVFGAVVLALFDAGQPALALAYGLLVAIETALVGSLGLRSVV